MLDESAPCRLSQERLGPEEKGTSPEYPRDKSGTARSRVENKNLVQNQWSLCLTLDHSNTLNSNSNQSC